jgi:hypothetical protein
MPMLPGKRVILFFFSVILNIRLLSELPRALTTIGWGKFQEDDFNRLASTLLLTYCFLALSLKTKVTLKLSIFNVVAVIIAFVFVSIGIAINTFETIGMPIGGIFVVVFRYVIEIVLVIFTINFITSEEDLSALFSYFFKPALFILITISVAQIATSSYGEIQGVNRIVGPFGSPTTLAGFLHLFIALTFYYYEQSRKSYFWFLIGIQYVLLIFTGSVTIILGHLVFLYLISWKQRWIKSKRFYTFFPFLLVVVVGGIIYNWHSIMTRLSILIDVNNFGLVKGSSIQWRFDAWKTYLSLLENDFIKWCFGLGVGTQRYILHPAYQHSLWRIFESPGTHSDYLGMLIDFGLIGLLLFLCGLVAFWNFMVRAETQNPRFYYLRFYWASILFIMMTENYVDQLIMFIFLIFLTGIYQSQNHKRNT